MSETPLEELEDPTAGCFGISLGLTIAIVLVACMFVFILASWRP